MPPPDRYIPVRGHFLLTTISGGELPLYDVPKGRYPREVAWLNQRHAQGALITSVCSGSLLLAEAGLLDGHQATAHWAYRDVFQRHFPEIKFRNESVLCLAAENERIVTAGGVSAWHDLAVYLIACTFSRRFRAATGFAPIEYVQALRIEEAKQMLETGELSNDDVGTSVGYDDPASFRRVFKRGVGLSLAAYRKKFQRISQITRPVGTI